MDISFVLFSILDGLQVLRLWLERKIMPESVIRRHMDDIGVSNDGMTVSSLRRPSRAERAVDDPIREMEGMLVDEYGRSDVCFINILDQVLVINSCYFCFIIEFFLSRVAGLYLNPGEIISSKSLNEAANTTQIGILLTESQVSLTVGCKHK